MVVFACNFKAFNKYRVKQREYWRFKENSIYNIECYT